MIYYIMITKLSLLVLCSLFLSISCFVRYHPTPSFTTDNPIFLNETFYTGTLPISGKGNLFYWIFESRNNVTTDPLCIWIPGGPGYAAEIAIFDGNGPYTINQQTDSLEINPYSWNNMVTMVYLDLPLGAGFSNYSDPNQNITDVYNAFTQFMQMFVTNYPQYRGKDLYIAGESFAGHFVTLFASNMLQSGTFGFNLVGIYLGNSLLSYYYQYPSYAEYAYQNNLINNAAYLAAKAGYVTCDALISQGLYSQALTECQTVTNAITGNPPKFNYYDIRENCTDPPTCYNYTFIETFLTRSDVQAALNLTNQPWVPRNSNVSAAFSSDMLMDYAKLIGPMLDMGLWVTVYNGDQDFDLNWIGAETWTNSLSWSGSDEFKNMNYTGFESYGEFKHYGTLIFYKVYQAGQFVPRDQPAAASVVFEKSMILNEIFGFLLA